MRKTLIRNCAIAVIAALAAPAASAAETGFYVGGFYGTAEKDEAQTGFDNSANSIYQFFGVLVTQNAPRFDKKSKGYGFFGGYRFFQNLAVEGGYIDLGSVAYRDRATGTFEGAPDNAALNIDSEIGGIAVSALGILPVSYRWELYGRAGVMFSTHKYQIFLLDDISTERVEFSDSATDLLAGVGASFLLAEVYTLRAEAIRVFDAGSKNSGEGDVDLLTVGITVRF